MNDRTADSKPLPSAFSDPHWVRVVGVVVAALGLAAALIPVFPTSRSAPFLIVVLLLVAAGSCAAGVAYYAYAQDNTARNRNIIIAGGVITVASALSPAWFPSGDPLPEGVVPFTSCEDVSDIPQNECEALRDLFTETNGSEWITDAPNDESGWLRTATPCSEQVSAGWIGVDCSGGQVSSLSLSGYGLAGELSESLGDLSRLELLFLSDNNLTGQIPRSLTRLTGLSKCDLAMNEWSAVDNELGSHLDQACAGWEARPFSDCAAVQGLPPSECQALVDIWQATAGEDWQPNEFVADPGRNWLITDSPCAGDEQGWRAIVCREGHVEELYLGNMNLVGPLPASVGDLVRLRKLHVYSNEITAPLPESLVGLDRLEDCFLWENPFDLPTSSQLLDYLDARCRFNGGSETIGLSGRS